MKKCLTCGIEKPLSEFHKHAGRKDGHSGSCKVCACARTRSYHVWVEYPEVIDLNGELWLGIAGNDGYFISNMGRVKTLNNRLFKNEIMKLGYIRTKLKTGRKLVHVLVAEHFVPNPNNKPEVNHINGIKSDNRAENLEWVTKSENLKHAFATGLKSLQKEKNPFWGKKHSEATLRKISLKKKQYANK